ncbi:MAG: hypothetical protein VX672_02400, partial [Planctomycetota bacterium]|nr:hypothetical protein [Planctomycetota bacterium]
MPLQRGEDPAHAPVDLLDDVAVRTAATRPSELSGGVEGNVRHRMGDVEEEWPVGMLVDEVDRRLGGPSRQLSLIRFPLQDLRPLEIGKRVRIAIALRTMELGHVVGVGNPLEDVEALIRRQVTPAMPEMPLAETAGRVAPAREHVGDGVLVGVESVIVRRKHDMLVQADPLRIATGQQRRPRGRTDRRRHVELGEAGSLRGEPIQMRGPEGRMTV